MIEPTLITWILVILGAAHLFADGLRSALDGAATHSQKTKDLLIG